MPKVLARRYGGKVYLAKWIVSNFPEHKIYVEPFAGSAAVLFHKEPSQSEVINDLDAELIGAFEIARSKPYELAACLWATPYSNVNWRNSPKGDIEKACLTIAKSQQFYAGAIGTSTFSVCSGHACKPKPKVWADWFQRVLPAFLRLKDVTILSEDALKTISRFSENQNALIYCDPPYVGHEKEYTFSVEYEKMVEALSAGKCKAIVSGAQHCSDFFGKGWRCVEKNYCVRAMTGAHKQRAATKKEFLFIKESEWE